MKLGQLLATRPDLVPQHFVDEFAKLHAEVSPLPFSVVEDILKEEYGARFDEIFESVNPVPLGSASIAQVHMATLRTGEKVVLKVQRPGIIQIVNEDLNVLYFLAELFETYIPESKSLNPTGIVDEFFKTLELETNFLVEANNIRRFAVNFENDPNVVIPKVYLEYTTERVLVLEALEGIPLSSEQALRQEGVDPNVIVKMGLRAYLKMVFVDGLFHGDLHAGNFFVLPQNKIGLIDFGVVGRFNKKTQTAVASMMLALKNEDYERLAYEYVDLAPFSDRVDVDLFAKELRDRIAPFYGLTMKNVNLGKILMGTSSVAAEQGLIVPTDLMLFFKSIVTIEGLGRRIAEDFDFLTASLEFAGELVKNQYHADRLKQDLAGLLRDVTTLGSSLPRHLKLFIRKINSPEHQFKLKVLGLEEVRRSVESSSNLLFLSVLIGSMILSASYISVHEAQTYLWGAPVMSTVLYVFASVLGIAAFFNYIRK